MNYRNIMVGIVFFIFSSVVSAGLKEGYDAVNNNDFKTGFKEFKSLADAGNAQAQFNLALMYLNGQGVEKDEKRACALFTEAANQGIADAQYNLAVMYERGIGVEKDEKRAVEWYTKAAKQEYAIAQYVLGKIYYFGKGVKKDNKQSVDWFTKAANQGVANAQYNLAVMYDRGRGVDIDEKRAFEWYMKAANQGVASAQFNLAVMYENGLGVKKDYNQAIKWYEKAIKNGDKSASENLTSLYYRIGKESACEEGPKLFNVSLLCVNRSEMRTAVKNAGGKVIREENGYWGDTYDSSQLLNGSSKLIITYTEDDNGIALAQYILPSRMDTDQVVKVRDIVASKYGNNYSSDGNAQVGKVSYIWDLGKGITLEVYRNWPETTTYLTYKHTVNYKKQQEEMDRQKREAEAKKYKSQQNNF